MEEACREAGPLVYLLAPSSSQERVELVTEHSTGFIYLVSVLDTTGVRASLPNYLTDLVALVRANTDTPVCVGFGSAMALRRPRWPRLQTAPLWCSP